MISLAYAFAGNVTPVLLYGLAAVAAAAICAAVIPAGRLKLPGAAVIAAIVPAWTVSYKPSIAAIAPFTVGSLFSIGEV